MMIRHSISIFVLCISLTNIASASGIKEAEHVVWDKSPIKFTLPVGRERRIDFPVAVKIQVPATVTEASKPIQVREDGSVYWTATEAFDTQRVRVITLTGYSYLIDVSAKKGGHSHPIIVLDDRIPTTHGERSTDISKRKQYTYDHIDLVRMASQNIYAPMRLTKMLPGVMREPVPDAEVKLYRGSDLTTKPMAQWKSPTIPSFYVTAIRVTSNSLNKVIFDPRLIRGDWLAASAQHTVVNPAGDSGDTTTWYLVSAHPYTEVTP